MKSELITVVSGPPRSGTALMMQDAGCRRYPAVNGQLAEPLAVAGEVNAFLQANLNLEAMAAAVDPALYRPRLA